jgi:hypothetical protein
LETEKNASPNHCAASNGTRFNKQKIKSLHQQLDLEMSIFFFFLFFQNNSHEWRKKVEKLLIYVQSY